MAGHLTEAVIGKAIREARAAGVRQELPDPSHRGLWLRIGKSGSKTWALRARDLAGKPHWFTLGHHPAMGLADARQAADTMLVAVRNGANPIAEQRLQRAASPPAPLATTDTLQAVLTLYEEQRGCDLKSWAHSRKRVVRVFAALLPRSVRRLTAAEFQITADQFPAKPSASHAVRALRPALRWAARRGYCLATLADFEQPVTVKQRQRVLTRTELAVLLPQLDVTPYGRLLHFLLLTLARLGEATAACWRDVDLERGLWTIPDTKSGEPHQVPLSRQALALLAAIRPTDADPSALVFPTSTGAALSNRDRETKRLHKLSGTAGWHRHDLRRTSATLLGETGTEPHIIEAALNHTAIHSRLAATYNRSRYRPQVADALQRLADALDGIEQGSAESLPLAVTA